MGADEKNGSAGFGKMKAAVATAAIAVAVARAGMMPPQVTSMLAEVTDQYAPLAFDAFERNEIPDFITRLGIRYLLAARLEDERQPDNFAQQQRLMNFVDELKNSPIAVNTADANEQHYEVPAQFYELVLGKYAKYSSALYPEGTPVDKASDLLDEAGAAMLSLYAKRAQIDSIDGPFRCVLVFPQSMIFYTLTRPWWMATSDCLTWDADGKAPSTYTPFAKLRTVPLTTCARVALRQGLSGAVVCGALSERNCQGRLQLQLAARMDHGKSGGARPYQS